MFALSYVVEVNPSGAEPVLSRQQVWRGLEMQAKDALPFVPGMTRCDILERTGNQIPREVSFAGASRRKRVTLRARLQGHFERVSKDGFIENTIGDSERRLLLEFAFGLNVPDTKPGSEAERQKREGTHHGYVAAVDATLYRVRQAVSDKEIQTPTRPGRVAP